MKCTVPVPMQKTAVTVSIWRLSCMRLRNRMSPGLLSEDACLEQQEKEMKELIEKLPERELRAFVKKLARQGQRDPEYASDQICSGNR